MDRNQIDVQTLSTMLDVSSVTIRNDLEALEKQGFIIRTHGGAVLNDAYTKERIPTDLPQGRELEYDKYKDEIAQIASHLIADNEWIFLGPGTTCGFLAKCLVPRSRLNIITNNLYVVSAFAQSGTGNVIVTGGKFHADTMFLDGGIFSQSLQNLHISKAFFSVSGVDIKNGFSVSGLAEVSIYTQMRKIADQVILLADYSKFNVVSFAKIGDLTCFDTLISNENIPAEYKVFFFEHGIKLFTSYEIKRSSVQGSACAPVRPDDLDFRKDDKRS